MISISSALQLSLPDAGGRDVVSPPASEQPRSPKLGNFSSIFDDWPGGFTPASEPAQPTIDGSGDPVKSLQPPGFLLSSSSSSSSSSQPASSVPRGPAYSVGFLSGLDFSAIEPPSRTPESLVLDTISEDDSGQDDEDKAGPGGISSALLSGKLDLFMLNPDVVIASPSTSPSATITAAAVKAAAEVTAATTPTRPIAIRAPKRTPAAHAGSFSKASFTQTLLSHYDLPYPLGSVPTPMIPSAPLAGSPMLNHPIQPLSWYTKQEKLDLLELKLKSEYKRDRALKFANGTTAPAPDALASVHVFVDLSNIVIGFYNRIRADRGIPQEKKMKAPPFFFEAFSRILERGRTAARRVTAGSAPDSNNRLSWPLYMRQADALGYEMNILSRVTKSIPSPRLKPNKFGHKKTTSRNNNDGHVFGDLYSSDDAYGPSSPPPPSSFKLGEQGVDEILHLKMCQSLLDHDRGTIVLATGDAAEAEFSDGFLKHAERALGRGWCVELLSWKMGISNAWRELERKQKGTGLFRIIELDKYSEDLLDMSIE